jgi:hypothetical protein
MLLHSDLMHSLVPQSNLILFPVWLSCRIYFGVRKVMIFARAEISFKASCSIGGELGNYGSLMTVNGFFLFSILNRSNSSTF